MAVLACALTSAPAFAAGAEGAGLTITSLVTPPRDIATGSVQTCSFRITNHTDQDLQLNDGFRMPAGWREPLPPSTFVLGAKKSVTRIAAIQVPQSAESGHFEVKYSVWSELDLSVKARTTLPFEIKSLLKLTLQPVDKPEFVIAGNSYQCRVLVSNDGNTPLQVAFTAGTGSVVTPASAAIPARGNVLTTVTVATDKQLGERTTNFCHVIAQGATEKGQTTTSRVLVGVDLYPRVRSGESLAFTLPGRVTYSASGRNADAGMRILMTGNGPTDEAGKSSVDYAVNLRNNNGDYAFSGADRNAFVYHREGMNVRLGDQPSLVSTLIGPVREGRGVGMDFRPLSNTTVGAYLLYGKESRVEDAGIYAAAFFRQQFGDNNYAQLNVTNSRYSPIPDVQDNDVLMGLQGHFTPLKDVNVDVEYARNSRDAAYLADVTVPVGNKGSLSYRLIDGGPAYYSSYHDTHYEKLKLSYPLMPNVVATIGKSNWQRNLSNDLSEINAPAEELMEARVRVLLPMRWYAQLGYEDFRHHDRLNAMLDYTRNPLSLGVGQASREYNWYLEYRQSPESRMDSIGSTMVHGLKMSLAYSPNPRQQFSMFAGLSSDTRESKLLGSQTSFGGTLDWQLTERLRMNATLGMDSSMDEWVSSNRYFILNADYALSRGRSIGLQLFKSTFNEDSSDTSYELNYQVPFDMPIGRRMSIGEVTGRVFDANALGAPGVADAILLCNGNVAVTDKQGRFSFPALPPGKHVLAADVKSIGIKRIFDIKVPLQVEVRGGETSVVNVGVIPAATVTGKVEVSRLSSPSDAGNAPKVIETNQANDEKAIRNVLVEMKSDDGEVKRRFTDDLGGFYFEGLRPIHWTMTIYRDTVMSGYTLEPPTMAVELKAGEDANVTFRLLPKRRSIIIVPQ